MSINFEGRVAIVTGAGNGLGRSHALALAERGAKVVVNDLGGARDGTGASSDAAMEVVSMIEAAGGQAFAHGANVANFDEVQDMVAQAMEKWGRGAESRTRASCRSRHLVAAVAHDRTQWAPPVRACCQ